MDYEKTSIDTTNSKQKRSKSINIHLSFFNTVKLLSVVMKYDNHAMYIHKTFNMNKTSIIVSFL
jgi:hypothetical protein